MEVKPVLLEVEEKPVLLEETDTVDDLEYVEGAITVVVRMPALLVVLSGEKSFYCSRRLKVSLSR